MNNNTGKFVLDSIEAIAATPSKLEKRALIKKFGDESPLFLKSAVYAYDPFRNYGITYVEPQKETSGLWDLAHHAVDVVLDKLVSRELSGNSAQSAVDMLMANLDAPSAELLRRIIHKDMRAGFSEASINEAFKGSIAEFPYMRCTLPEKSNMEMWDWSEGIFSQLKANGMFANVNHDLSGNVWLTSRQGSRFPDNVLGIEGAIATQLRAGTQTHGELTVYLDCVLMSRKDGNGVLNSLLEGGALAPNMQVVFDAWDQIPLTAVVPKGSFDSHYEDRFYALVEQCSPDSQIRTVETRLVHSKGEAYTHYREVLAKGLEGTVVKHPNMGWRDTGSGGNKDQVKLKLKVSVELRITGFNPGKKGKATEATFGSLQCESECGRLKVGVSGMSAAQRLHMSENRESYLRSVITVDANEIMEPSASNDFYSLSLPTFGEMRKDKPWADTLEQIQEQFAQAVETA